MRLIPESRRVLDMLEAGGDTGLGEALAVRATVVVELVPSCIAICLTVQPSGLTVALADPAADLALPPSSADRPDVGDLLSERRWQHERAGDEDARCTSSIAMALYEAERVGWQLSAYATRSDAFTAHTNVLLALVGAPTQTAVLNHDLPMRGLQDARACPDRLADREAIEVAVGYLMARDGIDADTARRHLSGAAGRAKLDVSAYAKALVGER
ncbi:ANTAR domain-containing protein [Cellulomonas sp. URHD0024]|uniref:ANTAR domain-containing protein n=1 Tax=Cellulomonas sp. URHD0024 TaxID=1302620 RepID=UPI0004857572|nr:ANTAR domain-containing protein [Cellulomonas sp. URHD0024]